VKGGCLAVAVVVGLCNEGADPAETALGCFVGIFFG
jgi:hypothetical protein